MTFKIFRQNYLTMILLAAAANAVGSYPWSPFQPKHPPRVLAIVLGSRLGHDCHPSYCNVTQAMLQLVDVVDEAPSLEAIHKIVMPSSPIAGPWDRPPTRHPPPWPPPPPWGPPCLSCTTSIGSSVIELPPVSVCTSRPYCPASDVTIAHASLSWRLATSPLQNGDDVIDCTHGGVSSGQRFAFNNHKGSRNIFATSTPCAASTYAQPAICYNPLAKDNSIPNAGFVGPISDTSAGPNHTTFPSILSNFNGPFPANCATVSLPRTAVGTPVTRSSKRGPSSLMASTKASAARIANSGVKNPAAPTMAQSSAPPSPSNMSAMKESMDSMTNSPPETPAIATKQPSTIAAKSSATPNPTYASGGSTQIGSAKAWLAESAVNRIPPTTGTKVNASSATVVEDGNTMIAPSELPAGTKPAS